MAGLGLILCALGGLVVVLPLTDRSPEQVGAAETPVITTLAPGKGSASTPAKPSDRPTATLLPPPTVIHYGQEGEAPSAEAPSGEPAPRYTSTPAATPTLAEPVYWTTEEQNALSWMCSGEVGGMGSAKTDACLSAISTVHTRYATASGFPETDVLSTLQKPNQFHVTIRTDVPTDMLAVVELYMAGARGSCTGYIYFNSIPAGPAECVIYGAGSQFLNFHNSW